MKTKDGILTDVESTLKSYIETNNVEDLKSNILKSINDTRNLYPNMERAYSMILDGIQEFCQNPKINEAGLVNPRDLLLVLAHLD